MWPFWLQFLNPAFCPKDFHRVLIEVQTPEPFGRHPNRSTVPPPDPPPSPVFIRVSLQSLLPTPGIVFPFSPAFICKASSHPCNNSPIKKCCAQLQLKNSWFNKVTASGLILSPAKAKGQRTHIYITEEWLAQGEYRAGFLIQSTMSVH